MKFIVEFQLQPGSKNRALDAFEEFGPNRQPGVEFRGAWIATRSDLIFALVESGEESIVSQACQFWTKNGSFAIHPVVDIEQA